MRIRNSKLEGLIGDDLLWIPHTSPYALYFDNTCDAQACNRVGEYEQQVEAVVPFISSTIVCYRIGPSIKVHR